ncbi:MAG: VIT domain-containing protein [bacterium]|nr:VIT domain-containing protein [bacterium]
MKKELLVLVLLGIFITLNIPVFGDGFIIPIPPPHRPLPPETRYLDIIYHKVNVEIENQVAVTSIDQEFRNPFNFEMEGTYIFPIPEDASISEFAMWVGGKKVSGEVLAANEARKIYEDIVRQMKDPALLEYMGRNMFKARVYPIEANGKKRIELKYEEVLRYDYGLIRYEYPLDTERFSNTPLETVVVNVNLKTAKPILNIYSPTHNIEIKKHSSTSATISFEEKNTKPDKNFVLYYSVSDTEFGVNMVDFHGFNEDGYFMMMVAPGQIKEKEKPSPKNITFILDTSGSMAGNKIEQAKNALKFCLNSLNDEDRFNVINFSSNIYYFQEDLVDVNNESISEALDYVNDLKARGGTDINNALLKGIDFFKSASDRPNYIVFITDGEPTVGVTGESEIIKNVRNANGKKTRIFVFGVGYNLNTILLDRLGKDNSGFSDYITPEENIEVKVSNFYSRISDPILSDISLKIDGIKTYDLYPMDLGDIFAGTQLTIVGRYKGSGTKQVTLEGKRNGKPVSYQFDVTFEQKSKKHKYIPRLWAIRKIGYLLEEIKLNGESKEVVDEITELGTKYGIVTPYTSFLITEEEQQTVTTNVMREMESGSSDFMQAPAPMAVDESRMKESTGKDAVAISKSNKQYQNAQNAPSNEMLKKMGIQTIKNVEEKTFYLKEGKWIDSVYKESMKKVKVKYLSDEYFKLIKDNAGINDYIHVSNNMILVFNNTAYEIYE